jgi:hypothetical protein
MSTRRLALTTIAAAFTCLLWPVPAHAASLPPATEAALRTSDLIYVATRRHNGALSAIKPIWFYYDGGKIFTTSPDSWRPSAALPAAALHLGRQRAGSLRGGNGRAGH